MNINLIKIASIGGGLATGGVIGGCAYYLINQNKNTNLRTNQSRKKESKAISEWLSRDGKILLQTGVSEWSAKWNSFNKLILKKKLQQGLGNLIIGVQHLMEMETN